MRTASATDVARMRDQRFSEGPKQKLMVPTLGTVVAAVLADRDGLLRSMALVVAGAVAVIATACELVPSEKVDRIGG